MQSPGSESVVRLSHPSDCPHGCQLVAQSVSVRSVTWRKVCPKGAESSEAPLESVMGSVMALVQWIRGFFTGQRDRHITPVVFPNTTNDHTVTNNSI